MNKASDEGGTNSQAAQFQLLRAHVEREVRRSSVIMVTSAEAGDGKSLTAHRLAQCLAESGLRTALVDATHGGQAGIRRASVSLSGDGSDEPIMLSMPRTGGGQVREAAARFVESSRAAYDYTIVDTEPLLTDNVALALAAHVDGVLVSVRVGRAPTKSDDSTMQVIEHTGGRIIGIVATEPSAIGDFEEHNTTGLAPLRSDRREERTSVMAMQSPATMVIALVIFLGSMFLSKWLA
jgi:hypothetical protein